MNKSPSTLKELLEQHPEYADVPVTIYRNDGTLHYICGSGSVYLSICEEENNETVLVFAPN